ncbi:MAG: ABC transporter ATP-binding protein/permease [Lachnospiraceae bacterium]|nr:ABC transporter ATP-binding protein/permease [Lachnospiraceae bacterium]
MKQSISHVMKNNIELFKLCFQTAPGYVIYFMSVHIRTALSVFIEYTICFNYVLECVEFGRPFKDAALFIGGLLIAVFISLLFDANMYGRIQAKYHPLIQMRLKEKLYQKAKEIDLSCYDGPGFYNEYILVVSESDKQIDRIFDILGKVSDGLTLAILSLGFIIATDSVSMIFVFVSFTLIFMTGKKIANLNFKIRVEKNPAERRIDYLKRLFYLNDYAKEIRLNTDVSNELLKDFDKACDESLEVDQKTVYKRLRLEFLRTYVFNEFIFNIVFISYLAFKAVVLGQISFSNVVVLHGTANRTRNRLYPVAEAYPQAQEISMYMDKIHSFLALKPTIVSQGNQQIPEVPTKIELRNVSFKYGKNDDYVLQNINMTLSPYSKTAIVGYNGAGKTTLTKLIMRLYDPDEGEILLNGINIKEYQINDYRRKIGAVFQDFKIFAATVKENVLLDFANKGSDEAVLDALDKSGAFSRVNTLSNGINTELTTEFEKNGVNLSGGEGQKVAIARVFYSDSNLILLDEPSSALDPIAEYQLNNSMLTAAENKSVLFISHRLSTTRQADKIYMLENGRIIEEGSHTQLLMINGKYAEMWRAQAMNYIG